MPGERFASMFFPVGLLRRRSDYDQALAAAHVDVPYEQAHCARLAIDIASRLHYAVEVVDVNSPDLPISSVERVIGTGATFPVLVRPDGNWIEGAENFTPSKVRKFLT